VADFSALKDCAGGIERNLEMPDKYYPIRSIVIILLLSGRIKGGRIKGEN
jgi:hypothetical protein